MEHVLGTSKIFAKKTLKATKEGDEETFHVWVGGKDDRAPVGYVPIRYFQREDLLDEVKTIRAWLKQAQINRRQLERSLKFCKNKSYYTNEYVRDMERRVREARKEERRLEADYRKVKARLEKAVAKHGKKG